MTMRTRINWEHGHLPVAVPGTAEQLPDILVPGGHSIVVRALPTNTGNIFLGKSKADAEDADSRLSYSAGNGVSLNIQNANKVWVDAAVVGEGVDYWTEV